MDRKRDQAKNCDPEEHGSYPGGRGFPVGPRPVLDKAMECHRFLKLTVQTYHTKWVFNQQAGKKKNEGTNGYIAQCPPKNTWLVVCFLFGGGTLFKQGQVGGIQKKGFPRPKEGQAK